MFEQITNNVQETPGFKTDKESAMILNKSVVKVSMQGISVQTEINQYFENNEKQAIEAIYTFPLPLEAILLDIIVTLDDKIIRGSVQKKVQAMERYEKAIEEGDTSLLLEKIDDGLFTLNIGNLLPSQEVKVTLIYSEVLNWQGKELRYVLPTVIAPKYGYCPLEPQQQPNYDYRVEYHLEFVLHIKGALANCSVVSPSHVIESQIDSSGQTITLQKEAFLDRDLIINLQSSEKNAAYAIAQEDEDEYAVIATFNPSVNQFNQDNVQLERSARVVNILVDCSGSMQGDSINLAKKALLMALDQLGEQDFFSITRFGNRIDKLTHGIVQASKINLVQIRRKVRYMEADLGGTEIFSALNAVLMQDNPSSYQQDCFLVTDGEIWDNGELEQTIHKFKKKQQRVFTVGVGSAVSEKLVKQLASETRGSSEFVSPNENMVEKIERHFKRIFMPSLNQVHLDFGQAVLWQSTPQYLFVGDSVTIYSRLKGQPSERITLSAITLSACIDNQIAYKESLVIEASDNPHKTTVRQVAHQYLQTLEDEEERAKVAVKYQLMDKTTAFIMVEENEVSETQDLPAFRKVPQMMAAGWSGQGSIHIEESCLFDEMPSIQKCVSQSYLSDDGIVSESVDMGYLDIPAFLRRQNSESIKSVDSDEFSLFDFIGKFIENYELKAFNLNKLTTIQLVKMDMPDLMARELENFINSHKRDESLILLYFMSLLAQSDFIFNDELKEQLISLSNSIPLHDKTKYLTEVLVDEFKKDFG